MIGVVGQARRSVDSIKEWFIKDLLKRQKVELDGKIDEMLKPPKKTRITIKFTGRGLGIGKRIGGIARTGLSLVKKLF
jgi:hypothetical protein